MIYKKHLLNKGYAIEIITDEVIIRNEQDALDWIADIQYNHGSKKIIIHKHNLEKDFFDLKTRLAGGILQKFTNYGVKLSIIGDYSNISSKALKDFIYESNKNGQMLFTETLEKTLLKI